MEDEQVDANEEEVSSTPQDENVESSTTDLAEPTAEQGDQGKDVPFHEHPRWQEKQKEAEEAKAQAEYYKGMAEASQKFAQPTQKQPQVDPYAGMDAQTKVFYQDMETRMKSVADSQWQTKEAQYNQVIQQQTAAIANLQEKAFRSDNADVAQGSVEERQVAELIRKGVPPDQAAWAVMGPKRTQEAERKGTVKKTATKEMKAKANLETSSIPAQTGIPATGEKLSFGEKLQRKAKEVGMAGF